MRLVSYRIVPRESVRGANNVIFYPQTVDKNREELFLVRGSKGLISTLINETLCKSIFLGTRRIERERDLFFGQT